MSLPTAFLDELRARTTLSTLVGKSVKITKAGREYKGCCPFHNEKTPSFYVNDEKGFYHCFGCSAHGDAIRWMTDHRGLPFMDAVKELAASAGLDVPAADPRAAERAERANSLYDVMQAAADWFVEQLGGIEGQGARSYLDQRGLKAETVKAFGMGYAPDSRGKLKTALARFGEDKLIEAGLLISVEEKEPYDRFRGRLMIPIRDARGRVIAFGGRILGAGEPKYLNSPDTPLFDKGRTLYNIDRAGAFSRKSGRVVVVEGYLDVIMMAQADINDVVAPLGTALTEHQIERLWRYSNVPTLCFDGDVAGQKAGVRAAHRALPFLKPGFSLEFVSLAEGKDPADMVASGATAALLKMLSLHREDLSSVLWKSEVFAEPLESPSARAGLRDRLDKLSMTIADNLVQQEFKSTFKNLFWEHFGWGRKRADDALAVMTSAKAKPSVTMVNAVIRAVLHGLSRYPAVLRRELEQIGELHIENEYLCRWRDILVNAVYDNPSLDESLIDTILAVSDVSPVQRRDLTRDLGFSFYFRPTGDDRPSKDLREVIATLNAERAIEIQLAQATERFKAATESAEWQHQQYLMGEREAVLTKLRELGDVEADPISPRTGTIG